MNFYRGFKSDCERRVSALRAELKLSAQMPIDMDAAAAHLEIPVVSLRSYCELTNYCRDHSSIAEIYSKVSAFTVFNGSHRTIIFNEEHSPVRHRSNMAHEISHAMLHHPPRNSGISHAQEELHEKEAHWLGGVLMLTATQSWTIARANLSRETAEARYMVSPEMLTFRLNVTGASRQSSYR